MSELKTFAEIKGYVHDASGIDNPSEWLWENQTGFTKVYYPRLKVEVKNGFIVLLVLMGGGSYQPVFTDDDGLMFFDTEEAANAEIKDCIDSVAEAVKNGDMSDKYTTDDYRVVAATLTGTTITCSVDCDTYRMDRSDDDYTKVN